MRLVSHTPPLQVPFTSFNSCPPFRQPGNHFGNSVALSPPHSHFISSFVTPLSAVLLAFVSSFSSSIAVRLCYLDSAFVSSCRSLRSFAIALVLDYQTQQLFFANVCFIAEFTAGGLYPLCSSRTKLVSKQCDKKNQQQVIH